MATSIVDPGTLGQLQTTLVIVSDYEIQNLSTGKLLIPAPGVGYVLDFRNAALFFDRVAAYTSGSNMHIAYALTSTIPSNVLGSAFLTGGSTDRLAFLDEDSSGDPYTKAQAENKPLLWRCIGADFATGHPQNVVRVYVTYYIWPTGF